MTANDWIQLDHRRASWLFLLLGAEDHFTAGATTGSSNQMPFWELGIANAGQFVSSDVERIGSSGVSSESKLINALMEALQSHRYEGRLLITPTYREPRQLRRMLMRSEREHPSLHGLRHVSLETNLNEYFGQNLSNYDFDQEIRRPPRQSETDPPEVVSTGATEKFWELWRDIYRLIPAAQLNGEEL